MSSPEVLLTYFHEILIPYFFSVRSLECENCTFCSADSLTHSCWFDSSVFSYNMSNWKAFTQSSFIAGCSKCSLFLQFINVKCSVMWEGGWQCDINFCFCSFVKQSVIQRVFTVETYVRKKPYTNHGKFSSQLSFMHECEAECNTKGSYCGNLCKAEIIRKVLWHSAVSFPVFPPIHNQQYSDWCMNSFRITSLLLKKKQEGTSHVFSEGTSMMME